MKGNSVTVKKIAKYLRHEVTSNNLKPGEHIGESSVAKKFNISRVPVREAFRILQSEGYLEVIPNKGCFVKKISRDYIYETSIVYRLFSPVILEKAIPRYSKKTFEKADRILDKVEKSKDFNEIGYLLWDFAKVIYSPSNMKFMLEIFDDIYKHSIRVLNELFEDKDRATFKITAHREFIELCKQNKKDQAIKLWENFIDKLSEILLTK